MRAVVSQYVHSRGDLKKTKATDRRSFALFPCCSPTADWVSLCVSVVCSLSLPYNVATVMLRRNVMPQKIPFSKSPWHLGNWNAFWCTKAKQKLCWRKWKPVCALSLCSSCSELFSRSYLTLGVPAVREAQKFSNELLEQCTAYILLIHSETHLRKPIQRSEVTVIWISFFFHALISRYVGLRHRTI